MMMSPMVFSKHLAGPPLAETARKLRAMNIDAIDLTVRKGGHVEPERVADGLLHAAQILNEHGVKIGMITTEITEANAHSAAILQTAQALGITHYKLGYFPYREFGTLRRVRDEARAKLQDVAQMNLQIGICAGFHNHSANFLGANLGDIDWIIQEIEPRALGVYFDAAHATIEGGSDGWRQGLDLLRERIVMLAVKDFRWIENGGYAGGRRFGVQWCPLQDGNVRWEELCKYLRALHFDGPVSLHSEYQGAHSWRDLSVEDVFEQTARDAEVWRSWVETAAT